MRSRSDTIYEAGLRKINCETRNSSDQSNAELSRGAVVLSSRDSSFCRSASAHARRFSRFRRANRDVSVKQRGLPSARNRDDTGTETSFFGTTTGTTTTTTATSFPERNYRGTHLARLKVDLRTASVSAGRYMGNFATR